MAESASYSQTTPKSIIRSNVSADVDACFPKTAARNIVDYSALTFYIKVYLLFCLLFLLNNYFINDEVNVLMYKTYILKIVIHSVSFYKNETFLIRLFLFEVQNSKI